MNQGRVFRGTGSATPMEDPDLIRHLLEDLRAAEAEFPIKVEGTHTLPYTAKIELIESGGMNLKLIRPLPHELLAGAPFEMLFATDEQRYRALVVFQGRQGYLLYRFAVPTQLVPSDQRRHKRYPFRPREKAYVFAQDGALPGHGLSGPLVNLSMGGLAFRVDRVLRLDDHLLLSPGLGFFDKGKILPMIKIRDLPKLPLLEARGKVANACERGGEVIVGVEFGEMSSSEMTKLKEVLDFREKMMHAPASVLPDLAREARHGGSTSSPGSPRVHPAGAETPQALRFLGRRTLGILMAMPPGPPRDRACEALAQAGYLRVETVDSLPQALAILRADRSLSNRLLMVASARFQPSELAEIQALQRDLGDLQELPVALLASGSADVAPPEGTLIQSLPVPSAEETSWLDALDDVAGLV
jgi:hypothetical protein